MYVFCSQARDNSKSCSCLLIYCFYKISIGVNFWFKSCYYGKSKKREKRCNSTVAKARNSKACETRIIVQILITNSMNMRTQTKTSSKTFFQLGCRHIDKNCNRLIAFFLYIVVKKHFFI